MIENCVGLHALRLTGSPMDSVRALVFDVFGTVVDWRRGIMSETTAFLARCGRTDIDPVRFTDGWRQRYLAVMPEVRTGKRPFTRLDVLHRETLEHTLAIFGMAAADFPDTELVHFTHAWHRLPPWADAVAGLSRLKKHYIIAPHSNGNIILLTNMAKRAGLGWDVILGAEVVHAYKQSPEAYFRTAEVLAMRPEEVCVVSAHNSDLGSARRCGMRTCFVPRPLEHGPGQISDLQPEQDWDLMADDFESLATRLGG